MVHKIASDPRAEAKVTALLRALSIEDESERKRAVAANLHKSLLLPDGTMERNVEQYSFKKASENVQFYRIPAAIHEVHEGNSVTVGFKETAERGRRDKYFVLKKEGVNGLPAPIHVFWPESDGAEPSVLDMGSL